MTQDAVPIVDISSPALSYNQSRMWMRTGIAVTLLFHIFYAAWLVIRPVSHHVFILGDDILETVGGALAALFCFLKVSDPGNQSFSKSRSRQVAWFCGLSMVCYTLQQFYIIYPDFMHHPAPILRTIVDTIALSSSPLLLLGICRLPRKPLSLSSQVRITLDGLMVMTSILTFSWYFVLGPTVIYTKGPLEGKIVDILYPTMDILLAACLVLLGGRAGYLHSVLTLFSIGLIIVVASDSTFAFVSLNRPFTAGTLLDIGWSLGFMLIGVAVFTGRQAMAFTKFDDDPGRLSPLWTSLLPYALLPLVGGLVLYTEQASGRAILRHGVFWGTLALVCLILVRQVLALLENRELNGRLEALATTDALTGLCNHRTFHLRLAEEAARASREGQTIAVAMLDLDNFKFFNDAYGHSAGDDVLRQITKALRQNTLPEDTLGRFGGDEFALILPLNDAGGTRRSQTAERLSESLEASLAGLSFQPPGSASAIPLTISIGIAIFPDDAGSFFEALELADHRLMHVKTGGGSDHPAEELCRQLALSLSGFTMLNALVTAVDNKDRYTRRHSEDVLTYSLIIADQLGLDEETRHTVQVAALLHDVGKIGVPDRILRKPGKLTEEEFQAVQQHPVMGAIIVGAVPGFEETLGVVRHHHERWDGNGYPFGLIGKETPFLARLIAVADAFSAMTTDRPYRKGMDCTKALRILEEGVGTQWDPECIGAILRAYQPAKQHAEKKLLAA
ncbi:MAG: bifunctional diguanylate cyclase/phosphohydrolase [Janthinobacterium lividum]